MHSENDHSYVFVGIVHTLLSIGITRGVQGFPPPRDRSGAWRMTKLLCTRCEAVHKPSVHSSDFAGIDCTLSNNEGAPGMSRFSPPLDRSGQHWVADGEQLCTRSKAVHNDSSYLSVFAVICCALHLGEVAPGVRTSSPPLDRSGEWQMANGCTPGCYWFRGRAPTPQHWSLFMGIECTLLSIEFTTECTRSPL